ncbi:MAG: hypothetical protein ACTHOG_08955 [Marmoricola sp.]
MPLTSREIERRLTRNEDDVLELYTMLRDVQRTVKGHDQRFDAVDARFDAIDQRLDGMEARFDAVDARLDEVLRRLPEINGS